MTSSAAAAQHLDDILVTARLQQAMSVAASLTTGRHLLQHVPMNRRPADRLPLIDPDAKER